MQKLLLLASCRDAPTQHRGRESTRRIANACAYPAGKGGRERSEGNYAARARRRSDVTARATAARAHTTTAPEGRSNTADRPRPSA
jgi:hypothetical protein